MAKGNNRLVADRGSVETFIESRNKFMQSIQASKGLGYDWVETTQEVLDAMFPQGFGKLWGKPVEFINYDGVKVCLEGQAERLQAEMDTPLDLRLHNDKGAPVGHTNGEARVMPTEMRTIESSDPT